MPGRVPCARMDVPSVCPGHCSCRKRCDVHTTVCIEVAAICTCTRAVSEGKAERGTANAPTATIPLATAYTTRPANHGAERVISERYRTATSVSGLACVLIVASADATASALGRRAGDRSTRTGESKRRSKRSGIFGAQGCIQSVLVVVNDLT